MGNLENGKGKGNGMGNMCFFFPFSVQLFYRDEKLFLLNTKYHQDFIVKSNNFEPRSYDFGVIYMLFMFEHLFACDCKLHIPTLINNLSVHAIYALPRA